MKRTNHHKSEPRGKSLLSVKCLLGPLIIVLLFAQPMSMNPFTFRLFDLALKRPFNFSSIVEHITQALNQNLPPIPDRMSGDPTVSYVTAPSEESARDLAKTLVQSRVAACVNIVKNVESIYEWKDEVHTDQEVLMIIKSYSIKNRELVDLVKMNIPYDCPEVITMKIEWGNDAYLQWVGKTISKDPITDPK